MFVTTDSFIHSLRKQLTMGLWTILNLSQKKKTPHKSILWWWSNLILKPTWFFCWLWQVIEVWGAYVSEFLHPINYRSLFLDTLHLCFSRPFLQFCFSVAFHITANYPHTACSLVCHRMFPDFSVLHHKCHLMLQNIWCSLPLFAQ